MDEKRLFSIVTQILKRGNNVEIRKGPDGSIQVFEIKKNKVT